jgi:hypothetical protein
VSLAELGVRVACVPDFAVRGQIASGSLVKILDEHVEHSGIFRAMWPPSQHSSPKLRAFVDYMAEHLFQRGPWQRDRGAEEPQRIGTTEGATDIVCTGTAEPALVWRSCWPGREWSSP